jgi:hypothetical protein
VNPLSLFLRTKNMICSRDVSNIDRTYEILARARARAQAQVHGCNILSLVEKGVCLGYVFFFHESFLIRTEIIKSEPYVYFCTILALQCLLF